jgi:hypothetical protein
MKAIAVIVALLGVLVLGSSTSASASGKYWHHCGFHEETGPTEVLAHKTTCKRAIGVATAYPTGINFPQEECYSGTCVGKGKIQGFTCVAEIRNSGYEAGPVKCSLKKMRISFSNGI